MKEFFKKFKEMFKYSTYSSQDKTIFGNILFYILALLGLSLAIIILTPIALLCLTIKGIIYFFYCLSIKKEHRKSFSDFLSEDEHKTIIMEDETND